MYKQQLAAAIKVLGKPLAESGETVYLPFDSEYSIMIHNYSTVKVKVDVYIDDKLAMDNLVIYPDTKVDLERWGNKAHKFKFIKRSEKIEAKRGIRMGDGLVRLEYHFEKRTFTPRRIDTYFPPSSGWESSPYQHVYYPNITCYNATGAVLNTALNAVQEPGITVQGSSSDQTFVSTPNFETDGEKHVIIFKLCGETKTPISTTDKIACMNCGTKLKLPAKFCWNCGQAVPRPKSKRYIYCPECGTEAESDHKYCFECGTNLQQ